MGLSGISLIHKQSIVVHMVKLKIQQNNMCISSIYATSLKKKNPKSMFKIIVATPRTKKYYYVGVHFVMV